jgi:predicted neuraminidase
MDEKGNYDGKLYTSSDDPERTIAFLPTQCVQNHASNIYPLINGDLLCTWFAGTQEGMSDISVYLSRLEKGSDRWSDPVKLTDDPLRSEQNPTLFQLPDGRLWLFHTAQKSGHQDQSEVRALLSHDNGVSWKRIPEWFDTRGIFVRQSILVLKDSGWLLPIFYCKTKEGKKWSGDYDYSAVKITHDEGKSWEEIIVPDSLGCVHMNVNRIADGSLLSLFRSRWADWIYESRSYDEGKTWTKPVPTTLPNNNSSIQFTILKNGHLALVFNNMSASKNSERRLSLYDDIEDSDSGSEPEVPDNPDERKAFWGAPRAPMTIAISTDGGKTWPYMKDLDIGDGYCMTNNSKEQLNREYSYPSIKQTDDGMIHVTYTYYRQRIKYCRFAEEYVTGKV